MPKYPNIEAKLIGKDGNAFSIMGTVTIALKKGGVSAEEIDSYLTESKSGDYDNLIATATKWVNVVQCHTPLV